MYKINKRSKTKKYKRSKTKKYKRSKTKKYKRSKTKKYKRSKTKNYKRSKTKNYKISKKTKGKIAKKNLSGGNGNSDPLPPPRPPKILSKISSNKCGYKPHFSCEENKLYLIPNSEIFKNSNIYNLYSKCKQEITINKFDDDSDKKYQYIASGAEGSVWKYDTNKVVKLPQIKKPSPLSLNQIKNYINEFTKNELSNYKEAKNRFPNKKGTITSDGITISIIYTEKVTGKLKCEKADVQEDVQEDDQRPDETNIEIISKPFLEDNKPTPDDITKIISILSKNNIGLSDIKEENVIKTGDNEFVIIDFLLSRQSK